MNHEYRQRLKRFCRVDLARISMNERKSMTTISNESLRLNPEGDRPLVDPTAYVDPTAQLIGNVRIGPRVYIGPNAVIRADEADSSMKVAPIEIGPECNIQDGVIIHALRGAKVVVGRRSSLAHGCIVHGPCSLGERCFVGFRATVFDAAVADGVFISTGAIVQTVELAAHSLIPPGAAVCCQEDVTRLVSAASEEDLAFAERVAAANLVLADGYNSINGSNKKGGDVQTESTTHSVLSLPGA